MTNKNAPAPADTGREGLMPQEGTMSHNENTVPQTPDIARAVARLEKQPESEGYVCWRMKSTVVRSGDWHAIEYDIERGWNFDLAPLDLYATFDQISVYADEARDLGLALFHLMGQGTPIR